MNPEYEKQLEAAIDRELKGLRELPAPETLCLRVMTALEQRASAPWYRQPWPMWPLPARLGVLLLLLAFFAALCFAGWKLQAESLSLATQQAGGWFSGLEAAWNVLRSLAGTVVLIVNKIGTGFIIGALAIAGLGYAVCIGLGTLYLRLAFSPALAKGSANGS